MLRRVKTSNETRLMAGKSVALRLVEQRDLDELYRHSCEFENKEAFFPARVYPKSSLRRRFERDGFWSKIDAWVLITDLSHRIVGCLYCFRPHPILQAQELAYIIFECSDRGHGYASEALALFASFLFRTTGIHRLELNIGTENLASIRVAEKAGFTREALLRSVWFAPGLDRRVDCYRYALLREEFFQK